MGCTLYSGVVSDDRTVIYRLKETLRIERARKGVQGGKELRDDRVDQAGRWGKECRSTMLKVAVIGVMGALLALLLKGEKAGQSLWVVLAACLLIMGISLSKLRIS